MATKDGHKADYFISYAHVDLPWAEWLAWVIEEEGKTVVLQEWDFAPGSNFVLEMDSAARTSAHTIAVLTPRFLASHYTQPEWATAFAKDPGGDGRGLIPVRVEECVLEGLLAQVVYVDLVGKEEAEARRLVLQMVRGDRMRPLEPPGFPGAPRRTTDDEVPPFPLEEEGFLDLVDRGVSGLQRGNAAAEEEYAESIKELSASAADHAEKFRLIGKRGSSLPAYKQVSQSAARGMNDFSERAQKQLMDMSTSYESGFGAWVSALQLLPEFGDADPEVLRGNVESLDGILGSVPAARDSAAQLRDVVAKLPPVDGVFAVARRRAAGALDSGVRALDRVEFLARRTREEAGTLLAARRD